MSEVGHRVVTPASAPGEPGFARGPTNAEPDEQSMEARCARILSDSLANWLERLAAPTQTTTVCLSSLPSHALSWRYLRYAARDGRMSRSSWLGWRTSRPGLDFGSSRMRASWRSAFPSPCSR